MNDPKARTVQNSFRAHFVKPVHSERFWDKTTALDEENDETYTQTKKK